MKKPTKLDDTQEPTKPTKDIWDKLEIVSRPTAAFLTAAIIAIISFFGQKALTEMSKIDQEARLEIARNDQNARLYTELLARREDAESSLRKDMFREVMSGFFTSPDNKNIEDSLSKQVLKLELLAINFGDSLSLGPLFSEVSEDIERVLEENKKTVIDWESTAGTYQKRLRGLAKRVASSQLSTLFSSGKSFSFEVPMSKIKKNRKSSEVSDFLFSWPSDAPNADENTNEIELEGITRVFNIELKDADVKKQTVRVKLIVSELVSYESKNDEDEVEVFNELVETTNIEFDLDFFNFPLIDNTRLSNNQRFTLILDYFDFNSIIISGMVFPGLYASQRDKPFLNEAIQELNEQVEIPNSAIPAASSTEAEKE